MDLQCACNRGREQTGEKGMIIKTSTHRNSVLVFIRSLVFLLCFSFVRLFFLFGHFPLSKQHNFISCLFTLLLCNHVNWIKYCDMHARQMCMCSNKSTFDNERWGKKGSNGNMYSWQLMVIDMYYAIMLVSMVRTRLYACVCVCGSESRRERQTSILLATHQNDTYCLFIIHFCIQFCRSFQLWLRLRLQPVRWVFAFDANLYWEFGFCLSITRRKTAERDEHQ